MDIVTLDFETYYDQEYSLRKVTMEEYIRDSRFEVIGVGIKLNDGDTEWASGTHEQLRGYLQGYCAWDKVAVLAHNTMFDAAILRWIFNVNPRLQLDTLSMARAARGTNESLSLSALANVYGLGAKGTEVLDAKGLHRDDFSKDALSKYGDYCINDVELTYALFQKLRPSVPNKELRLIDITLSMFTEPVLQVDLDMLETHLSKMSNLKAEALASAGVSKDDLMSNPKFAILLEKLGVSPPTKISPRTGKETFAFAKSDEGFKALLEHENPLVQTLVATRLGIKSTLEETRTKRFIDIAKRGDYAENYGGLPIPLQYYASHTGRWGGTDKINIQNLPSRGEHAKALKKSMCAPNGHVLIDCDSSQIEARVLAWLAGQDDLVKSFAHREDVYVKMASIIYGIPEDQVTKEQRFVGKTTILGCGYGMGAERFRDQLQSFGVSMDIGEAKRIIGIYRKTNDRIYDLWGDCNAMLKGMVNGSQHRGFRAESLSVNKFITPVRLPSLSLVGHSIPRVEALALPSGLYLRYPELKTENSFGSGDITYKKKRVNTKIYGGKVVENVCQALARCIIGEQMAQIAKRYKVVLTVHDSIVVCVKEDELVEAKRYVETCMRQPPDWCPDLPLDCEAFHAYSYGDCDG